MKKRFIRIAANENGASSVLVIFMMLVLVTLGAFAITSANANYKLNRRTLDWNRMYYELDGKGEEFLCLLDGELALAEEAALEYVASKKYETAVPDGTTPEFQQAVYEGYISGELSPKDIISKAYMFYASDKIEGFNTNVTGKLLDISEFEAYTLDNGAFIDSFLLELKIKSDQPGSELCSLNVSVWVEPVEYEAVESEILPVRSNDKPRYNIEDWYEYQEPLNESEEAPAEELWDGSL